jgi:hypothetical protein
LLHVKDGPKRAGQRFLVAEIIQHT